MKNIDTYEFKNTINYEAIAKDLADLLKKCITVDDFRMSVNTDVDGYEIPYHKYIRQALNDEFIIWEIESYLRNNSLYDLIPGLKPGYVYEMTYGDLVMDDYGDYEYNDDYVIGITDSVGFNLVEADHETANELDELCYKCIEEIHAQEVEDIFKEEDDLDCAKECVWNKYSPDWFEVNAYVLKGIISKIESNLVILADIYRSRDYLSKCNLTEKTPDEIIRIYGNIMYRVLTNLR